MVISDLDEEVNDYDWFAVDHEGLVGHFTTGGIGTMPRTVAASSDDLQVLANFFRKTLLPSTEPNLAPKAQEVAKNMESEAAVARRFGSFLEMASRGLYSFDHGYALHCPRHRVRPHPWYHRMAIPHDPLRLTTLPEEIQAILRHTELPEAAFDKDDEVYVEGKPDLQMKSSKDESDGMLSSKLTEQPEDTWLKSSQAAGLIVRLHALSTVRVIFLSVIDHQGEARITRRVFETWPADFAQTESSSFFCRPSTVSLLLAKLRKMGILEIKDHLDADCLDGVSLEMKYRDERGNRCQVNLFNWDSSTDKKTQEVAAFLQSLVRSPLRRLKIRAFFRWLW